MGYFKEWQRNRKNIREAINRLPPSGNDPQQPQQPMQPKMPFVNSRQDVRNMEREADLELVKNMLQDVATGINSLRALEGYKSWDTRYPDVQGLITSPTPDIKSHLDQIGNVLFSLNRRLTKWGTGLQRGYLSDHMPSNLQPPPSSN